MYSTPSWRTAYSIPTVRSRRNTEPFDTCMELPPWTGWRYTVGYPSWLLIFTKEQFSICFVILADSRGVVTYASVRLRELANATWAKIYNRITSAVTIFWIGDKKSGIIRRPRQGHQAVSFLLVHPQSLSTRAKHKTRHGDSYVCQISTLRGFNVRRLSQQLVSS